MPHATEIQSKNSLRFKGRKLHSYALEKVHKNTLQSPRSRGAVAGFHCKDARARQALKRPDPRKRLRLGRSTNSRLPLNAGPCRPHFMAGSLKNFCSRADICSLDSCNIPMFLFVTHSPSDVVRDVVNVTHEVPPGVDLCQEASSLSFPRHQPGVWSEFSEDGIHRSRGDYFCREPATR